MFKFEATEVVRPELAYIVNNICSPWFYIPPLKLFTLIVSVYPESCSQKKFDRCFSAAIISWEGEGGGGGTGTTWWLHQRVKYIYFMIAWQIAYLLTCTHSCWRSLHAWILVKWLVLIRNGSLQNGTLFNGTLQTSMVQNSTALQNVAWFKTVHYYTIQLQNGT